MQNKLTKQLKESAHRVWRKLRGVVLTIKPPLPPFEKGGDKGKSPFVKGGKHLILRGGIILIAGILVTAGILFYRNKTTKASWYNSSWQYRKKLTFNNSSYGALTNQPVSIELTASNFDFGKARSDGYDIVFTDSDGTTLLTYTRETFSAGSQSARFWVKVPAIDANVNTDFVYMYYGNASAGNTSSAFANSFFAGAAGYLGMEDGNRTNGQTVAESVSAENMTAVAGAGTIDSATGARGNALTFNGSDEYLTQKVHDTKQGTVTASMAATVGFINDTTQDFSTYVGASGSSKPYMIVATDSAGKKAWGYIGEQGTGETLGSDLFDAGAGTFDSGIYHWTKYGNNTVVNDAQTLKITYVDNPLGFYEYLRDSSDLISNLTVDYLYKIPFSAKVNAGSSVQIGPFNSVGTPINNATVTQTDFTDFSIYFVASSASDDTVRANVMGTGEILWLDDFSLKQVLTPTTNGVKIYSTKTGTTQSWANVETGFNANAVSSYEIRKTDFQMGTGDVTLGAWVKTSKNDSFHQYVIGSANLTSPFAGAYFYVHNGKIQGYFNTNEIHGLTEGSITVADGLWKFIVYVFDRDGNATPYINGVADTATNISSYTTSIDNNSVFEIGSQMPVAGYFFNGSIDEPIILPSALTADQIGAYYNNTKASQSYVSFGDQSTRGEVESGSAGLLPLAHWKFNDGQGSTAQDATANNNDGTITGSSFWKNEEDCVQGKCVYLDGTNDWVSRAYDGDFNFGTSPFTVSGWFKTDTVSATKILAARYSSGGWKMYLNSSGNVCFGIDDDGTYEPDDIACSSARYDNNEWHFISAYRDTSAIYTYVDAKLAGSDVSLSATGSLSGSSPVLYVGIDSDGASNKFTGYLDDFKIFPYARSATQITEDYNAPGLPRGAATKGISFSSGSVFSGYKYRKKLTFANSSYGALTNQPVSVVLSSSNFDFTKTRSDGYDIIFTDSNGTTLLNFNREAYSAGSQSAKFWVKVPQIDAASATDYIYMYYGNASASDRSANFSSAFFSGAAGYWGMEDGDRSAVTDTVAESVADEDMLAITPTGTIDSATGARGNALTFNGTDEYLTQKVHDTKQGTVTASMAATVGFINDTTQDFSPYVGASGLSKPYMIVATDSAGKKAWGYIGEQGTGETLVGNLITNGDFTAWTGDNPNSWLFGVPEDADSYMTESSGSCRLFSTAGVVTIYQPILTAGKLYKYSINITNVASGGIVIYGGYSTIISTYSTAGIKTGYFVPDGSPFQITNNGIPTDITFDDISVQQVLTPTTNGVKIYSTKTGSTQSWANVETGFNANSVSSYEIRKTDFQITGAVTVGAWVKWSSTGATEIMQKNLTVENSTGSYEMFQSGNIIGFGTIKNSARADLYSNATIANNTWGFAVCVWDGTTKRIYINGVQDINTASFSGSMDDTGGKVSVGAYSGGGYPFNGLIDEPIILPSALTADQIGAYYNNTKASQSYVSFGSETDVAGGISATSGGVDLTTGLVGEWKLDEKSGTSAADSSGNGNTGTVTNGPVWVGGKTGGGVKMDGVDDYVSIPDF